MKISVTQHHIDKGERFDAEDCALALAYKSTGFDVTVGPGFVSIFSATGDVADFPLPFVAEDFRLAFDNHKRVLPFTFEMPELDNLSSAFAHQQFTPVPVT